MESPEKTFDLSHYLQVIIRRKWILIAPVVGAGLIATVLALTLPKVYESSTLILVEPQKVPTDYVKPTVTSRVEDRLQTISQQILSRTRLEAIIRDLNLYPAMRGSQSLEEIVGAMRQDVRIEVQGAKSAFRIAYQGTDPRTVQNVAGRLASLYIEENLKVREQQAVGTTDFLDVELQNLKRGLEQQEKEVSDFKLKHMGELPTQLTTNLSALERLTGRLKSIDEGIRDGQGKIAVFENQIAERRARIAEVMRVRMGEAVARAAAERQAADEAARMEELDTFEAATAAAAREAARQAVATVRETAARETATRAAAPPGVAPRAATRGSSVAPPPFVHPEARRLDTLKTQLTAFRSAGYTNLYPDVRRLAAEIRALEEKIVAETPPPPLPAVEEPPVVAEGLSASAASAASPSAEPRIEITLPARPRPRSRSLPAVTSPSEEAIAAAITREEMTDAVLASARRGIDDARLMVSRLQHERGTVQSEMRVIQGRVDAAPVRELQLVTLTRDYENTHANYQRLLDKRLNANIAENMEKRQKGEQFRVLDPANLPEKPVKPNQSRIIALGLLLGLVLGVGIAFLQENMDQSFQAEEEVQEVLGLPVLAVLPHAEALSARARGVTGKRGGVVRGIRRAVGGARSA